MTTQHEAMRAALDAAAMDSEKAIARVLELEANCWKSTARRVVMLRRTKISRLLWASR